MEVIKVSNLVKTFGDLRAVDGISFSVQSGALFAFLGLNGAGKSTTINIICSILSKDSGEVNVCGYDLDKEQDRIKKEIGVIFQGSVLDGLLSVKDNLSLRADFYGIKGEARERRINELAETLSFTDLLKRPYTKLSGGQRRRIDIARGLLNRPKVLILDEPTTGLDPQTRKDVWDMLERLRRDNGMTIFFSTHYMEEANKADKVVIMDCGKIIVNDTPNNAKNLYSGDYIKLYTAENEKTNGILKSGNYNFLYEKGCYKIKAGSGGEIKAFILRHHELFDDFEVVKGDMDDVFLNATGKKLSGEVL